MLKKDEEKVADLEAPKKLSREERRKIREKKRAETGMPTKMNKYLWFVLFFAGVVTSFDGWCTVTITLSMGSWGGEFNLSWKRFTNPDLFTYFGISHNPIMMGIILSIAGIGVVVSISFKYLIDKYGRRPMTLFTAVLFTTFTVLTGFSPPGPNGLIYFLIFRILSNYFLSADVVTIIMAEEAPDRSRGRLVGLVLSTNAIGMVACAMIQAMGVQVQIFGVTLTTWQSLFFLTIVGYIFIIPLYFFLKETKRFTAMKKYEEWRKKRGLEPRIGWFAPLNKKYTRVMTLGWITGFLGTLISFAQITFYALYFAEELNLTSEAIGVASLPLLIAGGLGPILAGPIIDRWGRRPTIHRFTCSTLVGGLLFSFPTAFVCGDIPNPLLSALAVVGGMIGIFSLTILTAAGAILGMEMMPTHIRSTASGWIGAISRGATIVAPFLMMYGSEKGGLGLSYQYMFALMGIALTTILFTLHILAPESKGRVLEEIVATEIYTKQKVSKIKYREPYYLYLLSFFAFMICAPIYSLTTHGSLWNILIMVIFYGGLSFICFILVIRVRRTITE